MAVLYVDLWCIRVSEHFPLLAFPLPLTAPVMVICSVELFAAGIALMLTSAVPGLGPCWAVADRAGDAVTSATPCGDSVMSKVPPTWVATRSWLLSSEPASVT